jgi:hypothetical protein
MIKTILPSDVSTRPLKVYKEWFLTHNDIIPIFGENIAGSFDPDTAEMSGGLYKQILYKSIKSQYYNNSTTQSIVTEYGKRRSYTSTDERVLGNEIVVIPVPQLVYGEGIKVGTVILEDVANSHIYTDDGYSNLVSGSSIYGNIFYDQGLLVLTTDVVSGSTFSLPGGYTLQFRATKTIYENEIFLSVLENEFNVSQNPTAIEYREGVPFIRTSFPTQMTSSIGESEGVFVFPDKESGSFSDYEEDSPLNPKGSYLAPYITTIALYDNDGDMVVVAKLPRPIKSLPDYPINFIVRFDT